MIAIRMETTGVFIYFLAIFLVDVRGSLIATKFDLCGPMSEVALDFRDESSVTIALASNEYATNCKMKIVAPETHVIYLSIIDNIPTEFHRDIPRVPRIGTCQLKVYQNETSDPVWLGDPCSTLPLTDIDLLHPEITLEWTPPKDSFHSKGKKLLVTAVGRGDICKDNLQHTCMSIGHEPLFCVSKYLLCDGNRNCPKGATRTDEDDKICKIWNNLFNEFKKSGVNDKLLNLLMTQTSKSPKTRPVWQDWTNTHRIVATTFIPTSTTESPTSNIESLSVALSHYGPWGYILLGMLICGTVLMFCGVWECFRKPKSTTPPEGVQNSPTTVLIINPPDENNPPRYDDIDPPSYSTLFPAIKDDDTLQEGTTMSESSSPIISEERQAPEEMGANRIDIIESSASASTSDNTISASASASITNNNDSKLNDVNRDSSSSTTDDNNSGNINNNNNATSSSFDA